MVETHNRRKLIRELRKRGGRREPSRYRVAKRRRISIRKCEVLRSERYVTHFLHNKCGKFREHIRSAQQSSLSSDMKWHRSFGILIRPPVALEHVNMR